jgi:crotonobetainyl-CoA:carnitine CoA-transferase CaiB-like acyl-CoA transferase
MTGDKRPPLAGVRVVALEQAVAAPFCSRQLADLGADVVKIERPDGGDFARGYDGALNGLATYFVWLNRGKRSIVCDLKTAAGLEVAARLIARADVFLHNLAPGAVERLGFGYDALAGRLPRLVWCGISGYGPDGPYRHKKAYDLLVQAEAGVLSVTGTPDAPAKVGVSIADIASGMYAHSSILAALINRDRTGRGERIDVSMLECLVEWMVPLVYKWHGTGEVPARVGMRHNMIVPYGVYACADGSVNFGIQNEREWQRFCGDVLGRPDIAGDDRFCSNERRLRNRATLEPIIEAEFSRRSRLEVIASLDRAGIANAAVNDVSDLMGHPQLAARDRWQRVQTPAGPVPAFVPPHNLAGVPPSMGDVPALGQHTQEILAEIGMDPTLGSTLG